MECNKCGCKTPDCNCDKNQERNRDINRNMNCGMNRGGNWNMNRNMSNGMNRNLNNNMNRNFNYGMNRNSSNIMNRNNERRDDRQSCCEMKPVMNEGCDRGKEPVDEMMPGMSFVPWQEWRNVFCWEDGIKKGTIFEELYKPYIGRQMR